MKTQGYRVTLMLSLLVVFGVAVHQAQSSSMVKASIPFDFLVGGTSMSAGEYTVAAPNNNQGVLLIQSRDKSSAFILTNAVHAGKTPEKGKLIFNRYGDQYFLSQVWKSGDNTGRELRKSRAEREVAKRASESQLASTSMPETVSIATRKP